MLTKTVALGIIEHVIKLLKMVISTASSMLAKMDALGL
jgi:hypothetical protein